MSPARPNPTVGPVHRWRLPLLALVLTVGAAVPAAAPAAPAALAGRSVPPPAPGPDPPRVPPLWLPVAGAVVRGFDVRAGPYGPGHRGIDIAAPIGEQARAPAAGTVVFAGPVAGTTWLTLRVAPGVLVTLGPLLDPATAGRVGPRAPLGRVGPGHRAGDRATLHLGLRVGGVYVDPLAYLVDGPRARLAPLPMPGARPGG
jgi:Peptidase family M23